MFKQLSVFLPAYNEEENIRKTVEVVVKKIKKIARKYEVLVIDDGSSDKTKEIVKQLNSKNSRIKLITHKKNKGYGGALKTGMRKAKYEWICFR